ncbi:(2Fe-2S) ferredoxin domain-containing protein [Clostridium sp. MB40-C1]|uniref:(2Fe-2S) ferredoxin domain-containing protein n=1 Tax=Clostridium sp. MB40-C1 TaxID=3070996 RepID=UPI0027E19011|nr:(2Fe-2S) ferredoxin domain-containing protein [Clostridium sp. MB40-C1]WMJ80422.1 (2Fe-2S) ferredoxin domain-containing protein [Clostridium sp. MB40-C1]
MKNLTIEDIEKIRIQNLEKVNQGSDRKNIRISVGMGTCGIAAGAGPVYKVIYEEIKNLGLEEEIALEKVGCIGACRLEPIIEVMIPGEEKVTYVKVTPNKARKIIKDHVVGGKAVKEFTIHLIENTILNDFTIISD